MEQALLKAFESSLHPDNKALHESNLYLSSIKSSPGLIQSTFSIATSHISLPLRQISAIFLKNLTKVWKDSRRDYSIPAADKAFLKSNIIQALTYSTPEIIRSQFEVIAFNIATVDFPWEEILSQISFHLSSNNPDQIYSALAMIRQIGKVYEQVLNERRNNMKIIVSMFFTQLYILLDRLITEENESKFEFISLILEIYWTCFYIDLPEEQATVEALQGWLGKCKVILEIENGELENQVVDEDEAKIRAGHPKWQCKKWCAQIVHRFFNRYFSLVYLKDQNKAIGEFFQNHWAVPLSELSLQILFKITKAFVPQNMINYLLKFITMAFKLQVTFEVLTKLNAEIISLIILPLINKHPSDEELWRNDPVEYLNKENDIGKAYYSAKSSAIELLQAMCEKSCLEYFISSMINVFQGSPNLLLKESLLFAFGSLCKVIKKEKTCVDHIEDLLFLHVLEEFNSSVGFLRSRACWVYSQFTYIAYKRPGHQEAVLSHVCRLMLDPELPVRIEAAVALPRLLIWDLSKGKVVQDIQNVLIVYLELMGQIDSEDLVEALEDIVMNFSNEIIPFALDFAKRLIDTFLSMAHKENNQQSIMAAITVLTTLEKIVDALDNKANDLQVLSIQLQRVFDFVFTNYGTDFFECTISLLTSALYYSRANSMENLYPYARVVINYYFVDGKIRECARDFLEELFAPIANFLQKFKDLSRNDIHMYLEIAVILVGQGYQEIVIGCKIFVAIIENMPVDSVVISQVLMSSHKIFINQESKKLKMLFAQIAFTAFWKERETSLRCLQNLGICNEFFIFVCENSDGIKEELQIIQGLLGISAIISIGSGVEGLETLMKELVKVLVKLIDRQYNKDISEECNGKEPEYMNMLMKLKIMESEEKMDGDSGELYESAFETPDLMNHVKSFLQSAHNFITTAGLSEQEKSILDKFMS